MRIDPPTTDKVAPSNRPVTRDRARDPDVQLSAMVPRSVRRAVRRRAEDEGTTVRTILLRVLKEAGLAEVDDGEIVDRRTTPATFRSGR
jgi:hypothetical protein